MFEDAIAIIGAGAMLPGGPTVDASWQMVVEKRSQIREVPLSRWDASLYYDPDPKSSYRTNSKIGSFLPDDIGFRTKLFAMPPVMKAHLDPTQQLALLVARQALEQVGATDRAPRNWAVFVGNLLGGSWKRGEQWIRTQHIKTEAQLRSSSTFKKLSAKEQAELLDAIGLRLTWSEQPTMTADSLPGLLGNLIASRISHYFNLHGPNFTVDAACATSLAAIEQAVLGLREKRFDAALAGGVDRIMDASSFIGFSKMGVLSPDGSRPFDAGANGFVMGEGCALFVLKRYEDALREGDEIMALIRGVGSSTDGLGRAVVAPNPEGQIRSLEAAYKDAKVDPATVDMLECHGTSTPIGDPTEIASLRALWSKSERTRPISIGSIKANIGHLKGAAGAASLLKATMALKHQVLPPQINFRTPNPRCEFGSGLFQVQTEAAPWEAPQHHPRRCGVSAFGFGGINYHVVMQEAPTSQEQADHLQTLKRTNTLYFSSNNTGRRPMQSTHAPAPLPLDMPILAFGAETKEALRQQVTEAREALEGGDSIEALLERARQQPTVATQAHRVALYANEECQAALTQLEQTLAENKSNKKLEAKGIALREGAPVEGRVAFMFPGQGSQYVQMMAEYREAFPIVQETMDEADGVMKELLPKPLSAYMCPPKDADQGTAFFELLQTEVLQPAVLTADTALWRLLSPLIQPDLVMGHSLGEYGAAIAAGVFTFENALKLVAARGEAIAAVADHMDDKGAMIGINTDAETVEAILQEEDNGYVIVANKNCPTQTIIAGATDATQAAAKRLEGKGYETVQLPVSHAFHSDIVSPASPFLLAELEKIDIQPPSVTLLSNVTAEPYPTDDNAARWIKDTLSVHLARPVEWQKMVERAYADGFRVFIEVGPKRALSSFVKDILKDKAHASYFSAHPKFGELATLGRMFAALVADGLIPYGTEQAAQSAAPAHHAAQTQVSLAPVFPPQAPAPATPTIPTPLQSPASPTSAFAPPTRHQPAWSPEAAQPMPQAASESPWEQSLQQSPPQTPAPFPMAGTNPVFADAGFWHFASVVGGPYIQQLAESYRMMQLYQMHSSFAPAPFPQQSYLPAPLPAMGPAYAPTAVSPTYQRTPAAPAYAPAPTSYAPAPTTPMAPVEPTFQPAPPPAAPTQLQMPAFPAPTIPDALAPAPAAASNAAAESSAEGDLTQTILTLVADRTGYEVDELGLDEHLEADLGIDSIRQVEVMSELRDMFQLPRDDSFDIREYTTLRALISYVDQMRGQNGREHSDDADISG